MRFWIPSVSQRAVAVAVSCLFTGSIAAHAVPANAVVSAGPAVKATATSVGASTTQVAVTFNVSSGGSLPTLSNNNVMFLGASGLDFTLGTGSTCTGTNVSTGNCTVYVNFSPKYPGLRQGAVSLVSGTGSLLATTYVSGIGYGPLATFTPGTITTIAGGGTSYVDGGSATATSLSNVSAVAVDGAGNVYLADGPNDVIRQVTPTGQINRVAGTAATACTTAVAQQTSGACGDGGAALSALLKNPVGIAVDGAGNLYISDTTDQRIRKVTYPLGNNSPASAGIITSIAGNGFNCTTYAASSNPCGDGLSGTSTSSETRTPYGLTVDGAGNVYFADSTNHSIREVAAATGIVTTVVGTRTACPNMAATSGACGDGGQATSATLYAPYAVTFDSSGNMYIADNADQRVRMVNLSGVISTIAGNGNPGWADGAATATTPTTQNDTGGYTGEIFDPKGVAVDAAGTVYIGDYNNAALRKLSGGTLSTLAGIPNTAPGYTASQDGGPASGATLSGDIGVAIDSVGNLYIAESGSKRIRKITAAAYPLSFGQEALGVQSATQTVAVNNIGNVALTLKTPTTGQNPSVLAGFVQSNSSNCPLAYTNTTSTQSLAVGASCNEILSYKPVVSGSTTGNLVFSFSAPGVTTTTPIVLTGSTSASLTMEVIGLTIPQGTASAKLQVTIGYGSTGAPVGTPTFTVNGVSTNVGAVTCAIKAGHNNCTAVLSSSAYAAGTYTIVATQPAGGGYVSASAGSAVLTVVGTSSSGRLPVLTLVGGAAPVATAVAPKVSAARIATDGAAVSVPTFVAAPVMSLNAGSGDDSLNDDGTKKKDATDTK